MMCLHSIPRYARDIPLLNLANILHRSRRSEQAVVPLLVATGISPDVNILHFMLGNVLAVSDAMADGCGRRCGLTMTATESEVHG